MQTTTVIWIELPSPSEEILTKRCFEKLDKYIQLAIDLREGKHHGVKWAVVLLCVEARGAIDEQPGTGCVNVLASANVQSVGQRKWFKMLQ